MGEALQTLILPTAEDVIAFNRVHIETTGGKFVEPYNLRYETGLQWVLGFIQHPLVYGANPYPSVGHKAGFLAWTIIADHVFFDGNKRTGMSLMNAFLLVNGYEVRFDIDRMVDLALQVYDYRQSGMNREAFCDLVNRESFQSIAA